MAHPIPIAVAIVTNNQGQVLLGRRKNPEEAGLYGFPGGKVEKFETVENCLKRETREETGLVVIRYRFLTYIDEFIHDHFLAMMFQVTETEGRVETMEPEKCGGWEWHGLDNLPVWEQRTKLFQLCKDLMLQGSVRMY